MTQALPGLCDEFAAEQLECSSWDMLATATATGAVNKLEHRFSRSSSGLPLIDKDQAFKNDSLLNDLPFTLIISQAELSLLGRFGVFSGGGLA